MEWPAEVPKATDVASAELEAALRKLVEVCGSPPPSVGYIPHASTIPGLARELVVHGVLAKTLNRQSTASAEKTREELATVAKQAKALFKTLRHLHRPALEALNYRSPWPAGPNGLETHLAILIAAAGGDVELAFYVDEGRSGKSISSAKHVTALLAQYYETLTGVEPTLHTSTLDHTPGGPFYELVSDVFRILKIRASPESQIRALLYGKRESKTGLDSPLD